MPRLRRARLLQQFARFPQAGAVKTRLAAVIGAEPACAVHEALLEHTARRLVSARVAPVELWLDRAAPHPLLSRLRARGVAGPYLQQGGDLGERMHRALRNGLARASAVVLVGSDCPHLDAAHLAAAFAALRRHDVVFGPAEDGGYVLIGCRRVSAALFRGIEWGSDEVLRESLAAARAAGLRPACLAPRYDIDRIEDLRRWRGALTAQAVSARSGA